MSIQQQQSLEEELLYGEEYDCWLMANYPEHVGTKDDLIRLTEAAWKFEQFLETIPEGT